MKFMVQFSVHPGRWQQVAERFLSGKGEPPAGLKLLGRWHKADMTGGYALVETDNAAAAYAFAAEWSDVMDQHSYLVVEDAEAGGALAVRYAAK